MLIREARPEDAEQVCELHRLSIQKLGLAYYPQETVTGWAQGLTPEGHRNAMLHEEDMFVAELKGQLVGFGSILLEDDEIRAIYVHPDFVRRGIGTRLLRRLEDHARTAGRVKLKLASSLAAVEFYACQGYLRGDSFIHRLQSSGTDIECVWMSKPLARSASENS